MQTLTNIYIFVDSSFTMAKYTQHIHTTLLRYKHTLHFVRGKIKLHLWRYSDNSGILDLSRHIKSGGNPNLGEGFKMLKNVITIQQSLKQRRTRSIFILFSGKNVLHGWEKPLKELYHIKEFACGLRYVVLYDKPDAYAKKAYYTFTETPKRVLRYFSPGRLCSLIDSIKN